jgi:hypothetical protein
VSGGCGNDLSQGTGQQEVVNSDSFPQVFGGKGESDLE